MLPEKWVIQNKKKDKQFRDTFFSFMKTILSPNEYVTLTNHYSIGWTYFHFPNYTTCKGFLFGDHTALYKEEGYTEVTLYNLIENCELTINNTYTIF